MRHPHDQRCLPGCRLRDPTASRGWRCRRLPKAHSFTPPVAKLASAILVMVVAGGVEAATLTVVNTDDSGAGSLRQAILDSNASSGVLDTIEFAIPPFDATVKTISPLSLLPIITDPVIIDGYTQPGASPNTLSDGDDAVLLIELNANGLTGGLHITAGSSTVRGLVINRSVSAGAEIRLDTNGGNLVEGNFLGTDAGGATDLGTSNFALFIFQGNDNVIGGTTPSARNVMSGHPTGIYLSVSSGNLIQGNFIGTDASGTAAIRNGTGVLLSASDSNTIGGAVTGAGNVISGSTGLGVQITNSSGNVVQGNRIGTDVTGTLDLGNGSDGVLVTSGTGNTISANSIFANGGLGIDLSPNGVNPNDAGDGDTGSNDLQNFPVLDPGPFLGGTNVSGTLASTPNTTYRVEVFHNTSCDASGNGEGQMFAGANDGVTTDGSGNADFTVTFASALPAGRLTATATDPNGNTSEFSACTQAPPTTTTSTTTTSTTTTSTATTSTTILSTTTTPSTSSTTTSSAPLTTTTSNSTTSTTLGDPCATTPLGPTFRSLNCRLAALLEQVRAAAAAGQLGPFGTKLPNQVEKAKERKEQAEAACAEPNLRRAKGRLAKGIRKMIQIGQTLNSRQARRSMDPAVRAALRAVVDGIRTDMRALRPLLVCPGDAAGG